MMSSLKHWESTGCFQYYTQLRALRLQKKPSRRSSRTPRLPKGAMALYRLRSSCGNCPRGYWDHCTPTRRTRPLLGPHPCWGGRRLPPYRHFEDLRKFGPSQVPKIQIQNESIEYASHLGLTTFILLFSLQETKFML
ncbi:MAG: hypothetical protein K940chlam9_00496 [Chlamydiae bacterium]|nr:hypothetical protein [Chlamydiota bacterium]